MVDIALEWHCPWSILSLITLTLVDHDLGQPWPWPTLTFGRPCLDFWPTSTLVDPGLGQPWPWSISDLGQPWPWSTLTFGRPWLLADPDLGRPWPQHQGHGCWLLTYLTSNPIVQVSSVTRSSLVQTVKVTGGLASTGQSMRPSIPRGRKIWRRASTRWDGRSSRTNSRTPTTMPDIPRWRDFNIITAVFQTRQLIDLLQPLLTIRDIKLSIRLSTDRIQRFDDSFSCTIFKTKLAVVLLDYCIRASNLYSDR